jgi:uncharacterized membrane protein YjjP (DUF1212 family)
MTPSHQQAEARRFVIELGRALHALGSPAYRIEDSMVACARALGLDGSFFATPTAIFAQIGLPGTEPSISLQRVPPGEQDLGKLAELYRQRDEVVTGGCSAADGLVRLAAILAAKPTHGPWTELPAHVLSSTGAAVFLGGSPRELIASAVAGLAVGALALVSSRSRRFRRVFEPTAAATAALFAQAGAGILGTDPGIVTIAGIVPLLPGLTFTTALAELAVRHLSSGSARLLGALATMLTMAVGVGLGARVGTMIFGIVDTEHPEPLSLWWQLPTALVSATAFAVLLRARWSQLPAVLLAVGIAFAGVTVGSMIFARELAAFVGAFSVSVAANLYARLRRRPAAVMRTPGLLLLVPGSLGFRGLTTALQQDFSAGSQFAFRMLLVGGALVAGLLLSNVLVPPPLDVEPDEAG